MKILKLQETDIDYLVNLIKNDGLVIFPFDTCYGLVCNPHSEKAVQKLLKYKSMRQGKPISVVVKDTNMLNEYVYVTPEAWQFINDFLPGPFTLVFKSKGKLVDGVESVNGTLGVRIPNYEAILKLVERFGGPLTATSANQSYKKTPYKLADILDHTDANALELIDLFVDAGELEHNPPSTVIDYSTGDIRILRKGSVIPQGASYKEKVSLSVHDTINIASEITKEYFENLFHRPLIFALQGDMGAGKTHFTKGVGKFLGIEEEIISPTFIISDEHKLKEGNFLYHIDVWRLDLSDNYDEFVKLGIDDMLKKGNSNLFNVLSIEWCDRVIDYLKKLESNVKIIWVQIDKTGDTTRLIKWSE